MLYLKSGSHEQILYAVNFYILIPLFNVNANYENEFLLSNPGLTQTFYPTNNLL